MFKEIVRRVLILIMSKIEQLRLIIADHNGPRGSVSHKAYPLRLIFRLYGSGRKTVLSLSGDNNRNKKLYLHGYKYIQYIKSIKFN